MRLFFVAIILIAAVFSLNAKASSSEFLVVKRTHPGAKPAANPIAVTSIDSIFSFEQFSALSAPDQALYLVGLQKMMLDISDDDQREKMDYQASLDPSILSWLLPEASAGESGRRCVYAGWVSELDVNGRYCLAPKSEGCGRRQVQCNPLLYGAGKCTNIGKSATAFCTRSAKSPTQIAKEILAKGAGAKQDWSNFKSNIKGYCESPRPTQTRVCAMIRTRLLTLERMVGKLPKPTKTAAATGEEAPAPESAPSAATKPATTVVTPASSTDSLPTIVIRPPKPKAAAAAAPTTSETPSESVASPLKFAPGTCKVNSLIGNIGLVGDDSRGWNLMNLESAQALMCGRDAIPDSFLTSVRTKAQDQLKSALTSDKWQKERKQSVQAYLDNFERCSVEANRLRSTGAAETFSDQATLTYLPSALVEFKVDGKIECAGCGLSDIEGVLVSRGVSVCNIRIVDPNGIGSSASQNGLKAPAASGAAR